MTAASVLPRRRLAAAGMAAVAVVGLVVGGLASARSDQDTARPGVRPEATSSESSPPPAVVNDCWVPASTGNISLSGSEAMELTTTAATGAETRRGQARLLTAVERTLALPPDQAATVAASLLGDTSTERLTCSYARGSGARGRRAERAHPTRQTASRGLDGGVR